MSAKTAKKFRRQVKAAVSEEYVSALFWLKRLPFRERFKIGMKIIIGKRRNAK